MKYEAILFDLDGTLVPMDMGEFTRGYFKLLAKRLMPFGVDPEKMVPAMWKGCEAMVLNDGSRSNREAFWSVFSPMLGVPRERIESETDDFYLSDFHKAKAFTGENPLALRAVALARKKAAHVVLATNPLFPLDAQESRMSWVGISPEAFDLVTAYEKERYCKPNPKYYLSVCDRIGVKPADCLLIGNDEGEDMYPASKIGMDCYLVTDSVIRNEKYPWTGRSGSFSDLVGFLDGLEDKA